MLGHEASFAYINAIQLAASKNLLEKRTGSSYFFFFSFGFVSTNLGFWNKKNCHLLFFLIGYMAHGLFVPNTHELNLLMVATIQKDLQSTNYLQICYGLNAALQVASQETIPAIVPMLQKLKAHKMFVIFMKISFLKQFSF